jgi:L-methionine (R)-S-oxide reductase
MPDLAQVITPLPISDVSSKPELYAGLLAQARALVDGEPDMIANLANISALIFHSLPGLNWAGFYLLKESQLVLGPFQGKPACIRIPIGRGVCGTAAERRRSVIVPDVHAFEGHIACDSASNSEIVVPVLIDGELVGVLDLDSPHFDRFDDEDRAGLEALVAVIPHPRA